MAMERFVVMRQVLFPSTPPSTTFIDTTVYSTVDAALQALKDHGRVERDLPFWTPLDIMYIQTPYPPPRRKG